MRQHRKNIVNTLNIIQMTIKHLVLSGGGPIMIQILSAIQVLENNNYINMNDIETIYGTSAGAIIGVILSLKFDWETINDYIIKRPWQDVFPIKVQNILDAYSKKGIFDIATIEKCFKPLFDAKDIPLNITLEEFYKLSGIELHMFSFEMNQYKIEDISHITYPNLQVLKAIQMTCALPILVIPVCIDDKCFMDGGIGCNYPLSFCIESGKNPDEIIGFKNNYSDKKTNVNNDSNMLDFLLNFLFKTILNVDNNYIQPTIKNEILFDTSYLTFDIIKNALSNIEIRRNLFEKGKHSASQFLNERDSTNALQDSI
jgi:predicted acylesterase/phospholipase RssA